MRDATGSALDPEPSPPTAKVSKWVLMPPDDVEVPVTEQTEQVRAALDGALARHDKAAAVQAAANAIDGGLPVAALYDDVLAPILAETGAAWQRGERHVWDEHLISATVRTIVELAYPAVRAAAQERSQAGASGTILNGRSALFACPPGETHDLGLRMVCDRFEMAGWRSFFLGADTPPDEIEAAARSLGVDAVVLTSSTHFHRVGLRRLVDQLRAALPDVHVWVGGPAFTLDRSGFTDEELVDLDALLGDGEA